ncbi:hypothetical protein ACI76O_02225 [Capnocytophaga cynodegmi]|uniref:hypothetical protein n=1 Tax=Capnocytophaga cynodegmi TaxID=28189 RepID=UPI00385EDAFE
MAIDGIKIIDSDSAYDIYNDITERYKNHEEVTKIIQEWLNEEENFCTNALHTEIYWTALAYSLWKIGHLPDDIQQKTLTIIKNGANKEWLKIDTKAQKQRQKALDKLAEQIQSENPKPIKQPKLTKKKEPYFELGDVLAIELPKGYGICFISEVYQTARKLEYHLACTQFLKDSLPTMDDFLNSKLACGKNNQVFTLKTDCWFNHKDLGEILPHLKKIGNVKFSPYELWVLSPAHNLEDMYDKITEEPGHYGGKTQYIYDMITDIIN